MNSATEPEPTSNTPILDAGDEISTAVDLLEIIRMAHTGNPDEERNAVATTAYLAVEKLRSAQALLTTAVRGVGA